VTQGTTHACSPSQRSPASEPPPAPSPPLPIAAGLPLLLFHSAVSQRSVTQRASLGSSENQNAVGQPQCQTDGGNPESPSPAPVSSLARPRRIPRPQTQPRCSIRALGGLGRGLGKGRGADTPQLSPPLPCYLAVSFTRGILLAWWCTAACSRLISSCLGQPGGNTKRKVINNPFSKLLIARLTDSSALYQGML